MLSTHQIWRSIIIIEFKEEAAHRTHDIYITTNPQRRAQLPAHAMTLTFQVMIILSKRETTSPLCFSTNYQLTHTDVCDKHFADVNQMKHSVPQFAAFITMRRRDCSNIYYHAHLVYFSIFICLLCMA